MKDTNKVELEAIYDKRNSFYRKAMVERIDDNNAKLYSYNTLVAEIKNGKPVIHGEWSQTTNRHIVEFLKQNGFRAENSKQVHKDYSEKPVKESINDIIKRNTKENHVEKSGKQKDLER